MKKILLVVLTACACAFTFAADGGANACCAKCEVQKIEAKAVCPKEACTKSACPCGEACKCGKNPCECKVICDKNSCDKNPCECKECACKTCDKNACVCEKRLCENKIAWQEDFAVALENVDKTGNLLVVYFTGSDWCKWCIVFDKEVLSKPEFVKYANANLQMVLCDFPKDKSKVKKEIAERNEVLAQQFGIHGFPTMVVINSVKKTATSMGYREGMTPKELIAQFEDFKNKEPVEKPLSALEDTK